MIPIWRGGSLSFIARLGLRVRAWLNSFSRPPHQGFIAALTHPLPFRITRYTRSRRFNPS
jgi:hypothetical protein